MNSKYLHFINHLCTNQTVFSFHKHLCDMVCALENAILQTKQTHITHVNNKQEALDRSATNNTWLGTNNLTQSIF